MSRGLKVTARLGQYVPDGRCECRWVGHETAVVAGEHGGLGFESFGQCFGRAPCNLVAGGRAYGDDDARTAPAEYLDRRLVASERLQHAEEEQFVVGLLFLRLPRRGPDAVGILIVLRLGLLSIVAGWRPGGGRPGP